MQSNVNGSNNDAFGTQAMRYNVGGTKNSAFGGFALRGNNTGFNNCAFGYSAIKNLTSGWANSAFGYSAMLSCSTGRNNSAFGYNALRRNTIGFNNAVFGSDSLSTNLQGSKNSVFGARAMMYSTAGDRNCAFGYYTLRSCTTNKNSAFGYKAANTLSNGTNCSVFGYNAQPSTNSVSNEITLGDANVTALRCQVTTITSLSDQRDKTDIQDLNIGLNIIEKVRPVSYLWDKREWYPDGVRDGSKTDTNIRIGFIAQELKEMMEQTDTKYLNLVYESNPEKLEATPQNLFVPAIKAIQELNSKVKNLESRIFALENK